ncbi:hypothetical protein [Methylobacterium sp. yr596]|uniref:hypothetical protein n=1 Tax=Methylobacterium sp. yr596 TaxID=1761800 RepID=UPI0008E52CD4|nr:hypothetical protein [Methylobacterium sp. yr596]SFF17091.1 hypothetical protein SAMN04487844_1118 [Methylobacterium sp. yr596]
MATKLWHDDFKAAGYRPYHDNFKEGDERYKPADQRMYQGSQQKRVTDERGTRYFINVDLYDFTVAQLQAGRSAGAHVQFSTVDEMGAVCDVSRSVEGSIEEVEHFFADLWSRMGWGYYEVDRPDIAPAHAA